MKTAPNIVTSPRQMLFSVAHKYPFQILLSVVLGFSGALFNGISTALIVPILMSLLGQEEILKGGPPILQILLSPFDQVPESYRLVVMALSTIFVIILKNASGYFSSLASTVLSRSLTSDLQEQGLKLILEVDLAYFSNARVGDLMNRLGGEMSRASNAITGVIQLAVTSATVLVFLGLMLSISWQLTIATTLLLPSSAILSQFLIRRAKVFSRILTDINSAYSGGLVELISGIRLVKATGNENREYGRFVGFIRRREQVQLQSKMNSSLIGPMAEVINITILFILVLLSRMLFQDQLNALSAIMVTYLVLLSRLLPYVSQLNSLRNQLAHASSPVDVVYDLLRRDNKNFMGDGEITYPGLRQGIEFRNVSFTYPNTQEQVLRNVTLSLPKGKTLALVGSSGAGKSTLADLLPRFYDPTSGIIVIDGCDLRDFDISTLRMSMGIVSQDTFLFNNTIRYNISYGRPQSSDEEVIEAARRANAYEFIARLPDGLDTLIGDRGVMLSGGQRQRLAIARALVQNPEILILDEATSALDTVSERLVQQAIDELSRDRTTLVIAHRLSTVQKADQIAVMEKGQVIELGSHKELLAKDGIYTKLCSLQFGDGDTKRHETKDEEQQRLMSQVSYEFRANLNSMLGFLTLLSDGLVDSEEERQELTDKVYQSTEDLLKSLERMEKSQQIQERKQPAIAKR
ncbi:ABC transporter ATP-binding protein [Leptolyngbya sp. PCC 6406]|uniref:ABC transporter ATP-binding protein n=1 Tax=Leptolyngbya sp. PCC 6406 TaxID=1173264 RepID=UPI0002ABB0E4|nr:ABC transporter ATP-binding protein [Leptolyngbya sp. PCC 6406]